MKSSKNWHYNSNPFEMKSIFSTLALSLSFAFAHAQHCPFCGASIYVLDITDAETGKPISGLKVYFLDSNKRPVMHEYYDFESQQYKPDTIFGWQNPKRTTFRGLIDNNNPFEAEKFRFWFANDGYVMHSYYTARYVVIEDSRIKRNAKHYKKQIIPIETMKLFQLCSNYSNWDLGEEYGTPKGFVPTYVALKKSFLSR